MWLAGYWSFFLTPSEICDSHFVFTVSDSRDVFTVHLLPFFGSRPNRTPGGVPGATCFFIVFPFASLVEMVNPTWLGRNLSIPVSIIAAKEAGEVWFVGHNILWANRPTKCLSFSDDWRPNLIVYPESQFEWIKECGKRCQCEDWPLPLRTLS